MSERQWVDANVIVRFLTKDSPDLSPRSLQLFRRAADGELVLRVTPLVVAEVVWVLGSFYRWMRRGSSFCAKRIGLTAAR